MQTGHSDSLGLRVGLAFAAAGVLLALLAGHVAMRLQGGEAAVAAGLGLAGVAASLCAGRWAVQVLVRPLRPATEAVLRLGAGDLSTVVDPDAGGGLQPLMRALHEVQERLFAVVSEVHTGTGNIALHAGQMTRDNDALTRRTHTQAESLQNTAASMEQLTAAVHHNAQTAQQAHVLVRTAAERAAHGGSVMREVVQTMESIRDSSQSIRDIIGVIDGIAFQTNILALNAAVEAARAGEQGRGFAVVAAEVRTLAKRCAEAAREVKALIAAAVEQVDAGGARVAEAGEAMAAIVDGVQHVATLIEQIDAACREQSAGTLTINGAVAQLDAATQSNAALVKDAFGTAQGLHERAVAVAAAVAPFRLGEREHGSRDDAVALVRAGVQFLQEQGREALLADINRLDAGRFIHRDLYLMAQDIAGGLFVAHGNNPGRIGTGPDVKDVEGKHFAREFARVAREQGDGWVDYKWVHPVTGQVFAKSAWVQRAGELVLSCAAYAH